MSNRVRKFSIYVISILLSAVLAGCCSPYNPEDICAFERPTDITVNSPSYVLIPPDEIEIHCTSVPEVHLKRQVIRPDGMISFENIGEVLAAGKTPMQLAAVLKEKILKLYTLDGDYPCDVQIAAYKSKLLYVFGQVSRPGAKICTGRDTVLNVVSAAQPTILAENTKIRVIRPSVEPGCAKIFELDFKSMSREGNLCQNVLLKEGDIVYVPPTILAGIAMTVEEFVRPIGRAFGTYNIVQSPL